jgi:hypothetical protein
VGCFRAASYLPTLPLLGKTQGSFSQDLKDKEVKAVIATAQAGRIESPIEKIMNL